MRALRQVGKAPVRTIDGLCDVRVRGSGRAGLSGQVCQNRAPLPKSGGAALQGPHPKDRAGRTFRRSAPIGHSADMTSEPASTGAAPAPPRPRKDRPSAGWFVLGLGLFLLSIAASVVLIVLLLVGFLASDATVRADGQPHRVSVSTDGDRLMWLADDDASCRVADAATGQEIPLRRVTDDYERTDEGEDLVGAYRFDPGSGELEVTCTPAAGTDPDDDLVLIGSVPELETLAAGVLLAIVLPGLLALVGLVIVLWTGILWSLRPARPRGV